MVRLHELFSWHCLHGLARRCNARSRSVRGDHLARAVVGMDGGIFGAIFIGLSIITIPKLGGAAYIPLLVAFR